MLEGFQHLPGYLSDRDQRRLVDLLRGGIAAAPFYRPSMPRTGKPFSVVMTNCGELGWLSDQSGGYRYAAHHPVTEAPWPPIPEMLTQLWFEVGGWPGPPQACLINHYPPGAKLGSHVDADEAETRAPVVSVSLGDEAVFHIGGTKRTDAKSRLTLRSGDVVVLGGAARLAYHGIDRIKPGTSDLLPKDLLPEGGRLNLTLRRVTVFEVPE